MINIGVLASGRGSNFQAIIDAVESGLIKGVALRLLLTDNPKAFALERAQKHGIESLALAPKQFSSRELISDILPKRCKEGDQPLLSWPASCGLSVCAH